VGEARAPITALRRVVRIAQPSHEFGPCSRRALDIPARASGLIREAETRQRWDDHMEGVFSLAAVTSGIRQGPITFANSRTDPGQPWLSKSGKAFVCLERTWRKWMPEPSISVRYWPKALSIASQRRQS
jgi:hypothetical protein